MFIYGEKEYDKVWFTSDEHYGSERALDLSKRLDFQESVKKERDIRVFKQTLENLDMSDSQRKALLRSASSTVYGATIETPISKMNTKIIDRSNKRVMSNDLVFHLGDFGDYRYASELEGNHILIMGNYEYDECAKNFDFGFEKFKQYIIYNYNFIDVLEDYNIRLSTECPNIFRAIQDEVTELFLTHKPTDCKFNWRTMKDLEPSKFDSGKIMNIFGHIHEKCKIKRFGLNVGVDGHHYYPVSQEEVDFYLYAILHHYDEDVFC